MDEENLAPRYLINLPPAGSVHPKRNRAVVTHAATELQNV